MNKNREKESGKLISVMSDKDCDKVEIMLPVMHELSRDNTILYLSKKDIYEESIFINYDYERQEFQARIKDDFYGYSLLSFYRLEDMLRYIIKSIDNIDIVFIDGTDFSVKVNYKKLKELVKETGVTIVLLVEKETIELLNTLKFRKYIKDIDESLILYIDRHKEIPEGYFYKIIEDEFKSVQINTTTWIEDVLKITGLGYKYVKVANF
ncbi:hypothetical protein NMF85_09845 [Clostridioides difficile]|uniref:hypothetical protein n=1 Tax=Clostridioides difficile TaxID=1496 RepID=UPI001C17F64A|nr:hypothetical protein [Clostridioides difficile]MCP8365820.1 hypothetical protein [Clostridioides difficile]MCP8415607.1 hypothetical protein [Clostridioides difficile]MCP8664486.1 hypothetical protein [Clostridioides difficile]MDV9368759.1 hypothetical protein [Clostridioides difficile]HBF7930081.1 hypothetical protein [Clostridioides difficile]